MRIEQLFLVVHQWLSGAGFIYMAASSGRAGRSGLADFAEWSRHAFGKLPAQAQTLIDVHRLRVLSQPYGITKIDAAPSAITIHFKPQPPIDPMRIIELIQKNKHIKLVGNEKLRIERALPEPAARAQLVRELLRSLGQPLAVEGALAA